MNNCRNCGAELNGKYCSVCGQEAVNDRLSVSHIIKDATHGMLHWENSILKTFRELLVRPGHMIRAYIEGKRKSFVKPLSYFIFIQTAYALVFHWLSDKYFAFITATVNVTGDMTEHQLTKFEEAKHAVTSNITYLNYIFPVIFAVFWKLFLKKKTGVNYAESLVAGFYLIGTTLFFGLVMMMLTMLIPKLWEARFTVNLIYFIVAIVQFSGYSKFKGILRGVIVSTLSYISYVAIVAILTLLYLMIFKSVKF